MRRIVLATGSACVLALAAPSAGVADHTGCEHHHGTGHAHHTVPHKDNHGTHQAHGSIPYCPPQDAPGRE